MSYGTVLSGCFNSEILKGIWKEELYYGRMSLERSKLCYRRLST